MFSRTLLYCKRRVANFCGLLSEIEWICDYREGGMNNVDYFFNDTFFKVYVT